MIIVKIVGGILVGFYGLYLLVGLLILLPEIFWALEVILRAPHKLKEIPESEYELYRAPLAEVFREITELLKDWVLGTYHWIIFPFLVIKVLIFKPQETKEAG